MHPVLLEKIAVVAPDLSAGLHGSNMMNAFSISPVMGVRKDEIQANQSVWVRIGLLNDEMESIFIDTMERGLWKEPVQIEDFRFAVESIAFGKQDGNPWSGGESFEDLVIHSTPKDRVLLRIESPMAFKRGDLHYPLPDPVLVFGNLLRRWNELAPFKFPDFPVLDSVSYSFIDIKTAPYPLRKGGTILGCTGKLIFIFKAAPPDLSFLNLLLNFGFYSGIGVKTSQGMGMCRVIHSDNDRKPKQHTRSTF